MSMGGWYLKPVGPRRTEVMYFGQIDFGGSVPGWITKGLYKEVSKVIRLLRESVDGKRLEDKLKHKLATDYAKTYLVPVEDSDEKEPETDSDDDEGETPGGTLAVSSFKSGGQGVPIITTIPIYERKLQELQAQISELKKASQHLRHKNNQHEVVLKQAQRARVIEWFAAASNTFFVDGIDEVSTLVLAYAGENIGTVTSRDLQVSGLMKQIEGLVRKELNTVVPNEIIASAPPLPSTQTSPSHGYTPGRTSPSASIASIASLGPRKAGGSMVPGFKGWVEKQSNNLGQWRRRYCVLHDSRMTFYKQDAMVDLTETFRLIAESVCRIKGDTQLRLTHKKGTRDLRCNTKKERDLLVQAIDIVISSLRAVRAQRKTSMYG